MSRDTKRKARLAVVRRTLPSLDRPMSAAERGLHWEDEGCLYVDQRGAWPRLETTQYERKPQTDYCLGASIDGVRCRVRVHHYTARDGAIVPYYRTEITGIANIARELLLYYKCGIPRTQKKRSQVLKFLAVLRRPRKKKRSALIQALRIAQQLEAVSSWRLPRVQRGREQTNLFRKMS